MIPYSTAKQTAESSARRVEAITPHDVNEVSTFIGRGIYVGVGGNIALRPIGNDADVTFVAVPAGSIVPVQPRFVRATGTTASSLLLLI
jgi:hypothetical protein